eukprot:748080-Hanusia_phi.AAC.1
MSTREDENAAAAAANRVTDRILKHRELVLTKEASLYLYICTSSLSPPSSCSIAAAAHSLSGRRLSPRPSSTIGPCGTWEERKAREAWLAKQGAVESTEG